MSTYPYPVSPTTATPEADEIRARQKEAADAERGRLSLGPPKPSEVVTPLEVIAIRLCPKCTGSGWVHRDCKRCAHTGRIVYRFPRPQTTEEATQRLAILSSTNPTPWYSAEHTAIACLRQAHGSGLRDAWRESARHLAAAYEALGCTAPDDLRWESGYAWHIGSHPIQIAAQAIEDAEDA
jgi:hypothetical protein